MKYVMNGDLTEPELIDRIVDLVKRRWALEVEASTAGSNPRHS